MGRGCYGSYDQTFDGGFDGTINLSEANPPLGAVPSRLFDRHAIPKGIYEGVAVEKSIRTGREEAL